MPLPLPFSFVTANSFFPAWPWVASLGNSSTLGTMFLRHTFPRFFPAPTTGEDESTQRVEYIGSPSRRVLPPGPIPLNFFFLFLIYSQTSVPQALLAGGVSFLGRSLSCRVRRIWSGGLRPLFPLLKNVEGCVQHPPSFLVPTIPVCERKAVFLGEQIPPPRSCPRRSPRAFFFSLLHRAVPSPPH